MQSESHSRHSNFSDSALSFQGIRTNNYHQLFSGWRLKLNRNHACDHNIVATPIRSRELCQHLVPGRMETTTDTDTSVFAPIVHYLDVAMH